MTVVNPPRRVAQGGLALAVVAELSVVTLFEPAFGVALPLARFGGMAWLVAAGALLPTTRLARRDLVGV